MSSKRKNVQTKRNWIDRSFDPEIMKRAKEIAHRYQVVIRHEDGEYFGRGLELPGAMDDGKTPNECFANTREAMVAIIAYMLEQGRTPPPTAV